MSEVAARLETHVLEAANGLRCAFQADPYYFLYESDLQAELFSRLRCAIAGPIKVPRTAAKDGLRPDYRVHPIATEYATPSGFVDVVCLDPDRPLTAPGKRVKGLDMYIYGLPILVGIELKYLKMGDAWNLFGCCDGDRRKLNRLRADDGHFRAIRHGLVLGFVQDLTTDKSGFSATRKSLEEKGELSEATKIDDLDGVYLVVGSGPPKLKKTLLKWLQ